MAKIGINIKEGTIAKEQKEEKEIIIGIDLGTTNSLVAYIDAASGEAMAIKDQEGNNKLVPSIIHFGKQQQVTVGNEARNYLVTDPQNTIYSVKRLMGKAYQDIAQYTSFFGYQVIDDNTESLVKIRVGDHFFTPIELSALILKQLKQRIETALEQTVSKAVITVPAYFNDAQRQATRDAGKLAGLEVLRIVNEPTAASLAYGIGTNKDEEQTIAVYDLGGGTFDISILDIADGIFEVRSTNGDTFLGGDDFDQHIINYWIEQNNWNLNEIQADKSRAQALRLHAEAAKKQLSQSDVFKEELPHYTGDFTITRTTFETLIQPLIDRTIQACKNALKDAGVSANEIDEVVLVGGSTKVPSVKKNIENFFGKKAHDNLNPDEVVALGAAVQADILAGNNKDFLLIDVTPLSLGIETMGGLMDVIIPRNSKVPARAGRQYTTHLDGQANMKISVYQGERDLVQDNRKLGEFHLKGIPAMPAGLPKVEISFILDADGITKVRAKELRSGIEQSIEVQPSYGLSEADMGKMLLESIQFAEQDMQARALKEAMVEAEQLVLTTERFIKKNGTVLNEEEKKGTEQHIAALKEMMQQTNKTKDQLQASITALNEFTRPFAERLMDIAVSKAMKGKKL